jgi:tetratricopeptide (TPR) repeat protein
VIEQQNLKQIKSFLDKEDYENAIIFLEKYIEKNREELNYYWYLGLVYLFQENEEEAQGIWLSILLQGNLEEIEQWTTELIQFLEIKAQENIAMRKLGNAKVIYDSMLALNQDYKNPELLNQLVESLSCFAAGLSYKNERKEAIEVYLGILNLNPKHLYQLNLLN